MCIRDRFTVVGVIGNALVMLPFYSNFMPLDTIIAAGAAINPAISNIWTFAVICVGPFNLVKGCLLYTSGQPDNGAPVPVFRCRLNQTDFL